MNDFLGYHILVKFFEDGEPGNNWEPSMYSAWHPRSIEGDLQGILARLDYITELGIDLVYLSPVLKNRSTHGYDTVDYWVLADHLSHKDSGKALELFRTVVSELQKRGIAVLMDLVLNHGSFHFDFSAVPDGYTIKPRVARTIQEDDWEKEPQGESPWIQDGKPPFLYWDTFDPGTQKYLIDAALYWLKETGINGFRLDYVLGLPPSFLDAFNKAVTEAVPDIIILGEIWDDRGDARKNYALIQHYKIHEGRHILTHAFDFFLYGKLVHCLAEGGTGLDDLWSFIELSSSLNDENFHMTYFMENHDLPRFINKAWGNTSRFRMAYLLLHSLSGSVMLEYGNEFALEGDRDAFQHPSSDLFRRISSRVPMRFPENWSEIDRELAGWTAHVRSLRSKELSLVKGCYEAVHVYGDVLAFWKHFQGADSILIYACLHPKHEFMMSGKWKDLITGRIIHGGDHLEPFSLLYLRSC